MSFNAFLKSDEEQNSHMMNEMQSNYSYHYEEHETISRMLESKSYYLPVRIDYSVLSVAVMTLGLIMIVEVIRHRIDHAAINKPFFQAVLNGVNSECKFTKFVLLLHLYLVPTLLVCPISDSFIFLC